MSLKFARFRSLLGQKVVAAVAALAITLTPRLADSYATGDLSNPPQSYSIHPLLVEPLKEAYHQVFPQSTIDFIQSEVEKGSIREDAAPTYGRSLNHFLQWQTGEGILGFNPSDQWAQDCEGQTLQGNHCWDKTKEDASQVVNPFLGENFGFWYHLNADLTVPAHVWNDAHPAGETQMGGLARMLGLYSDPYETWTDVHKGEIMDQVHPDLSRLPDTQKLNNLSLLMKDLAEFTGSNFYSADALDGRNPDNCSWDDSYTHCYRDVTDTNGKVIQSSVPIVHSGFFTDYPDSACMKEYWPILSSKAVEYGIAGISLLMNDSSCIPNCNEKECGDDGCGGTCGNCSSGLSCSSEGKCLEECLKNCYNRECGDDSCGGSCGSCSSGYNCSNGACTINCGADSCGGTCGDCPDGKKCSSGTCIDDCVSNCTVPQQQCSGNNIIGCEYITSTCMKWGWDNPKTCPSGYNCQGGECIEDVCTPNCTGKECGYNGCGSGWDAGNCGICPSNKSCQSGTCVSNCTDQCSSVGETACSGVQIKVCKDYNLDDCLEWRTSSCPSSQTCVGGKCVCTPQCSGKNCGSDGCGGSCGNCAYGSKCIDDNCCTPNCTGKDCGDDGCGGSCGSVCWPSSDECLNGNTLRDYNAASCEGNKCVSTFNDVYCNQGCSDGKCNSSCTPSCAGKNCGNNGCGGSCGNCNSGYTCSNGTCSPIPGTGQVGDPCTTAASDCSGELMCGVSGTCVCDVPVPCFEGHNCCSLYLYPNTSKRCLSGCSTNADCSSGEECKYSGFTSSGEYNCDALTCIPKK